MKRPSIYTRPDKPMKTALIVRERFEPLGAMQIAKPIAVDRATECHVTPFQVAARMVGYLDAEPDMSTLEPSAGTGQLSKALLAAGHSRAKLVQVERHIGLSYSLDGFGAVINQCFLEWSSEVRGKISFDRVIMNPPFSDVRKHVAAALSLLVSGGVLVALVPITFQHEAAETLETLPNDTFATAKVNTKLIRILKGA